MREKLVIHIKVFILLRKKVVLKIAYVAQDKLNVYVFKNEKKKIQSRKFSICTILVVCPLSSSKTEFHSMFG